MNDQSKEEQAVEDIPEIFWQLISNAETDNDKFKQLLLQLSKEELLAFYHYYRSAAFHLTTAKHLDYLPDDEDEVEDITRWVVSQGKDYFLRIYHHPEELPETVSKRPGVGFYSLIITTFGDQFNEDINFASSLLNK